MSAAQLLKISREIAAIAQTGLAYTDGAYDRERYHRLQEIAAELLALQTTLSAESIAETLSLESGYATPKVDVRGAVFRGEKILLVRERADGRWCLPGGWADINMTPRQCVQKELREESGLHVRVVKLAAVLDKALHEHPPSWDYTYKLFFLCEETGGELTTSLETDAVDFFAISTLPHLSLERTTARQIERMFFHYRHPDAATDVD